MNWMWGQIINSNIVVWNVLKMVSIYSFSPLWTNFILCSTKCAADSTEHINNIGHLSKCSQYSGLSPWPLNTQEQLDWCHNQLELFWSHLRVFSLIKHNLHLPVKHFLAWLHLHSSETIATCPYRNLENIMVRLYFTFNHFSNSL